MSSQRPNSNSRRQHSREPPDDSQPAPSTAPRLPSLRSLAASRERDNTSPAFYRRLWHTSASRRAERIRNLENQHSSTANEFRQLLDNAWDTSSATPNPPGRGRLRMDLELDVEDVERSLDEANSHLRALLESTNHASLSYSGLSGNLAPPLPTLRHSSPPHRPSDMEHSRRSKRRKLDSDRSRTKAAPVRYGKYGQVEPGQLKMEMVSCDGGLFSNEFTYAVENILKNDSSVYCTKGNRCNIVLRHQGETAFTLKELIIKGPTSMNYSHPIREGMVFVNMHHDDTLQRTEQYQIQYERMPRARPAYLREQEYSGGRRFALRRNADGDARSRPRNYRGDDDDYRIAQMPAEFSTSQANVGVSTECSDEDDGSAESSRRYRRAPNRIGSLPFEDDAYSDDDDEEDEFNEHNHDEDEFGDTARAIRERELTPGPGHESSWDAWGSSSNPQESSRADSSGQHLAPHARFFIEKKKSTCTIRFDPPVSGRYVLLKMWNSHHDPTCNIDIQSVVAKGWAGPRYFPSIELR